MGPMTSAAAATTTRPPRGILLCNPGSPAAPTPEAVGDFLEEFPGDPHRVDLNRALWRALRRLITLPRRTTPITGL